MTPQEVSDRMEERAVMWVNMNCKEVFRIFNEAGFPYDEEAICNLMTDTFVEGYLEATMDFLASKLIK